MEGKSFGHRERAARVRAAQRIQAVYRGHRVRRNTVRGVREAFATIVDSIDGPATERGELIIYDKLWEACPPIFVPKEEPIYDGDGSSGDAKSGTTHIQRQSEPSARDRARVLILELEKVKREISRRAALLLYGGIGDPAR
ncbi:hypothetical protein AAMO2058_001148500 [Amorphochlora amoebiformis]|uniref:Uncharacterized protein n=1 Tax=Amorphochlora amoebiformis TaxID=1561963 RepID=A0A7S0CQX5_9EUKA|mmetsp:Transcript_11013/g.17393  ORF Transcript_11013/g.17393 Transcript_11013/m.17393 type:complete len:141 (+) Transcript_11013:15-437(+)